LKGASCKTIFDKNCRKKAALLLDFGTGHAFFLLPQNRIKIANALNRAMRAFTAISVILTTG